MIVVQGEVFTFAVGHSVDHVGQLFGLHASQDAEARRPGDDDVITSAEQLHVEYGLGEGIALVHVDVLLAHEYAFVADQVEVVEHLGRVARHKPLDVVERRGKQALDVLSALEQLLRVVQIAERGVVVQLEADDHVSLEVSVRIVLDDIGQRRLRVPKSPQQFAPDHEAFCHQQK